MESSVETMIRYVKEGKIEVDKSKNTTPVCFHDSCNNARSCGLFEEPRELLQLVCADFREMYPNRAENYCCTGGGGAMSMSEYTPERLKSAKIKADQLKATGAKIVVTSCHNCVDGLTDLIKHYKLGMEVTQLVNLVANALVVPEKVVEVPEVPEKVEVVAAAGPLADRRVLVVDDEPDICEFITAVLEDNGATTVRATDGDQAVELLRTGNFDLMTLDLNMPGKDGGDVFEAIRNDKTVPEVPTLIISGHPELRRLIYDRHVPPPEGFLDKPIEEDDLLRNVRKVLDLVRPSERV
jgi:CheY-like chemotaxis protein